MTSAETPLFRLEGVSLGYGAGPAVLEGVDLAVRPGEFWFLLGANGEGKSTLLRAVLGLLAPRQGVIQWGEGFDRRWIGFVPQRRAELPGLAVTVREYIRLGLYGIRCAGPERRERIGEALSVVGLTDHAGRDIATLSGGQHQRALVARALVRRPRLLILDEPNVGLDPRAEHELLEMLAELRQRSGLALLFASHHLDVAGRYATHAVLLRDGRMAAGPAESLLTDPRLQETYGVPAHVRRTADGYAEIHLRSSRTRP